ncbi:TonB-dependent receptor plug domain-containing protein [Horticoccus sp. 23ND18S-11]|uniref:TonB-dependent receptor plug domain-containing protein n=1 Tax=Horticoccus sp. 23ND18S-11 TaxID=3391832 RepID=UPI0039C96EE6
MPPSLRSSATLSRATLAFLTCTLAGAAAYAQAVTPTPAPPANAAQRKAPANAGEVIALSAFEVQADPDNSYGALNSASITRFNVEMEKMPVSADIFTETFMKDVAATSVEDVINGYSAGTGNSDGAGAGTTSTQPGDRNGNYYIQIRGMNTPAMQRDSFMPVGAFGNPGSTAVGRTDNFDLERIEVINGPQALLYGGGGAGGVINVTSKQARFARQSFRQSLKSEALFRVDQYGSKRAELDVGVGTTWFAARFAFLRESTSSRRVNIGGVTNGQYGQLAFRFFQNTAPTTVRLSGSLTMNRRRLSTNPTLTAAGDPRNGHALHYLLATGQTGETNPQTGARYPAGAILNGKLNWDNVDSFAAGYAQQEPVSNDYSSVTIETKWRDWLTTQFAAGYDYYTDRRINPGFTFFAPRSGNNTTDNWAGAITPSDSWQPARTKAGRVAAVITKDLFQGRAKTQTLLGADYLRSDSGQISYQWYQADAAWNIIVAPNATLATANLGRTPIAQQRWSLNDGPTPYPWGSQNPARDRMTLNGVNYVRALQNPPQASLVTPTNPLGTPFTAGNYIQTKYFNKGAYVVNYTEWLGGRFNTLWGVRRGEYIQDRFQHFDNLRARYLSKSTPMNYNVGLDWNAARWLHPYVNFSDSVMPPYVANRTDPLGNSPGAAKGIGMEAGLKLNNAAGTLSGTFAAFQTSAKGDLYGINGSIGSAINPNGLNGNSGGSNFVSIDRKTRGLELRLTAAPTRNWRLRFSAAHNDGEIGSTRTYDQLYNDQFYANAAGQVTYRNGTVVYVNGAATNAAQATVVAATDPGAVPLSITMMSTPGATNPYFANPDLISGAINRGSAAANILLGTGNAAAINANGPILTGRVALPITDLQLNKTLSGVAPPGVIVATRVGDKTSGYPEYSANLTSNYVFTGEHLLKGLSLGGTFAAGWKQRGYYYYAAPVTAANALTLRRTLLYTPPPRQFNLIVAYGRKFGRYAWSTQVNVANLFNRYDIALQPNATTGYLTTSGINATFYQQPRAYTWTNSIKF